MTHKDDVGPELVEICRQHDWEIFQSMRSQKPRIDLLSSETPLEKIMKAIASGSRRFGKSPQEIATLDDLKAYSFLESKRNQCSLLLKSSLLANVYKGSYVHAVPRLYNVEHDLCTDSELTGDAFSTFNQKSPTPMDRQQPIIADNLSFLLGDEYCFVGDDYYERPSTGHGFGVLTRFIPCNKINSFGIVQLASRKTGIRYVATLDGCLVYLKDKVPFWQRVPFTPTTLENGDTIGFGIESEFGLVDGTI